MYQKWEGNRFFIFQGLQWRMCVCFFFSSLIAICFRDERSCLFSFAVLVVRLAIVDARSRDNQLITRSREDRSFSVSSTFTATNFVIRIFSIVCMFRTKKLALGKSERIFYVFLYFFFFSSSRRRSPSSSAAALAR